MEKINDCFELVEGVAYLWNDEDEEIIPLKEEAIQELINAGAPVFRMVNGEIIQLN